MTDGRNRSEPSPEETLAETWYDLPAVVEEPFEVFLNGVPQQPGIDYQHVQGALIFPRALKPEPKMSRFQWALGVLGIAGTYTKHDTLDVIYRRNGRRLVASGLKPRQAHE